MGYTQIIFDFSATGDTTVERSNGKHIENEFYSIAVQENGALSITDKISGRVYSDQMVFEENGDDGDSYNYSPPERDLTVSSLGADVETITSKSTVSEELSLRMKLKVPYDLNERSAAGTSAELPLQASVSLRKGERLIRFSVDVDNRVLSHRLRVLFDTGIASKLSIADQPFGVIARPTTLEEVKVWEREQWTEKPITIEAMQSYVALNDGSHGVAVMTEGVREYEVIGHEHDTIALTLFRTFGYMGKENLLYRPGRASGEKIVETPDAQLLGELTFTFALHVHESGFDEAGIAQAAKEYLTPLSSYQLSDFLNGRLIFAFRDEERIFEQNYSLLSFSKDSNVILSAFKKAEHSDGYIVRVFNPYLEKNATAHITYSESAHYELVSLDERSKGETLVSSDTEGAQLPELQHCKLLTVLVTPELN